MAISFNHLLTSWLPVLAFASARAVILRGRGQRMDRLPAAPSLPAEGVRVHRRCRPIPAYHDAVPLSRRSRQTLPPTPAPGVNRFMARPPRIAYGARSRIVRLPIGMRGDKREHEGVHNGVYRTVAILTALLVYRSRLVSWPDGQNVLASGGFEDGTQPDGPFQTELRWCHVGSYEHDNNTRAGRLLPGAGAQP